MKAAIISYHDASYQPLADITWDQNKIPYCEQHGYHCEFEPLEGLNHIGQLQKVRFINRMLNDPAGYEWIWWTGCDLMITNFSVKIEDKIDENYHMVIATDCNGINADSILIKNSEEGRAYWKMVSDLLPSRSHDWEGEQGIIKLTYPNHRKGIKVVPQRDINSYDYNVYGGHYKPFDHLGTNGQWQKGDWVIQWPGVGLDARLKLAEHYTKQIIK
jgi:hypothetical protein